MPSNLSSLVRTVFSDLFRVIMMGLNRFAALEFPDFIFSQQHADFVYSGDFSRHFFFPTQKIRARNFRVKSEKGSKFMGSLSDFSKNIPGSVTEDFCVHRSWIDGEEKVVSPTEPEFIFGRIIASPRIVGRHDLQWSREEAGVVSRIPSTEAKVLPRIQRELLGVFGEEPKADEKALSHVRLVFLHNEQFVR